MPFAGKIAFNLLEFYRDLAVIMKFKIFFRGKFRKLLVLRSEFIHLLEKNIP
jgi:hypothetical protein